MKRYECTITLSILASRNIAQRIQDSFQEVLENWSIDEAELWAKAQGMTVEMTTLKEIKNKVEAAE